MERTYLDILLCHCNLLWLKSLQSFWMRTLHVKTWPKMRFETSPFRTKLSSFGQSCSLSDKVWFEQFSPAPRLPSLHLPWNISTSVCLSNLVWLESSPKGNREDEDDCGRNLRAGFETKRRRRTGWPDWATFLPIGRLFCLLGDFFAYWATFWPIGRLFGQLGDFLLWPAFLKLQK
jgi:hypothetical protein